jgi:selenocysteine lyase/cysteine desulfurase
MLRDMPDAWPDHLQAGTLNGPGIAGLAASVRFIESKTVESIRSHVTSLKLRLRDGLAGIPGVRLHSPRAPEGAPIITITTDTMDPATLAGRLDREFGILTRPGLHCAPETHRLLGTERTGALRLSFGWASTEAHADRALEAIDALAGRRAHAVAGAGGLRDSAASGGGA